MKLTIPVVTLLRDNGDGAATMQAYNTQEEMLADHYAISELVKSGAPAEEIEDRKIQILEEHDPYMDGYPGEATVDIEIEFTEDFAGLAGFPGLIKGVKLAKPLSLHVGQ